MKSEKILIITIDYELYFGKNTGTVDNCIIKPTALLADLLNKYNIKMTIFFDALYFWKLCQYEDQYLSLKKDKEKIEKQISELIAQGHELQLHLHPHWLDSYYDGERWVLKYDHYKLQSMENCGKESDYNIEECFKIGIETISKLLRENNSDQKVNVFRAGGWGVQPFLPLKAIFNKYHIVGDSSVIPGDYMDHKYVKYDYSRAPQKGMWRFLSDPVIEDETGEFIEVPITSVKCNTVYKVWYALLRKYKYNKASRYGDGVSILDRTSLGERGRKYIRNLLRRKPYALSLEGCICEEMAYALRNNEITLMIGHPKGISDVSLRELGKCLNKYIGKTVKAGDLITAQMGNYGI